ncbi:hypothetical protein IIA16_06860, partial [bacterium]|nr:hypothetical protein [bacterium]
RSVVGLAGVEAPAFATEGTAVMAALEEWRQAPFGSDLVVEFVVAEEDGPAGWYESDTGRLVVALRGTVRFGRGTMLHEMFHAHQDQRFGLGGLHRRAEANGPDAERALAALIEGEAMLAVQEIMAYDFSQHTGISETGPLDEERFLKIFHYGVGLDFVAALRDHGGGWEAVDNAFRNPPSSTAAILDAVRYLEGWQPRELPQQGIAEGAYGVWLFLARPEGRRAAAKEAAHSLLGDAHLVTATPEGERHLWRLEFVGEAPAMDWLGEALQAAGAGVGTAFAIYRLGGVVVLQWTEAENIPNDT